MKVLNCRDKLSFDDLNVIRIDRGTIFGNPFRMQVDTEEERVAVIEDYRIWFEKKVDSNLAFRKNVLRLRGHNLACWCAPKPCHGDVIISWLKTHTV